METITAVIREKPVHKRTNKRIYETKFDILDFSSLVLDFTCSKIYGQAANWSTD